MPAGVDTLAEPLANELVRRKVLSAQQAVDIVRQLAHEIVQRHESGRLHLHIAADMVSYDPASGRAVLSEPLEESRPVGGVDCDDEFCPPELQQPCSVLLPVQLAAARDALRVSGLSAVDPRRVDLYQLGALLCRLLTGESVSAFLSRPRVAAKVPTEVRDLIERALGHDPQRALRSAPELLRGLETLDAAVTVALPNALPDSTQNPAKPDTTPSFISAGKADTDAGHPVPPSAQPAELPFQKLGHYEIVGRIGHGGMGDVYQGYERTLDRSVAIKVLPSELARQEDFIQRFRAEATAAAKLIHPNILHIYFIGEDAGHHFFAMQLVEGESLADLLTRRGKLPVEETLAIIEQALSGLAAAHKHGLVHRDIKPGNILLDRKHHRVLLADFGLVKSLASQGGKTATGVVMGTVDYISPEQGRGLAVDGRSDLYSMGVLLFQMLSGRLPFDADNPSALIFQHVYEQPPSLELIAPGIPAPLSAIIDKLLKKSPADRHQAAEEILSDIRAFRAGLPLSSQSLAPAGARPERKTAIIQAPDFAEPPPLPADLMEDRTLDWWQSTKDRALSLFRRHAPEALQRLQNTQQQVDGAIAEYERRQRKLQPLVKEAEDVLAELQAQESAWDTDAADGGSAALSRDQLRQAIDQQQEQLASMRVRLAQINATLSRLQSQRDLLNARLKVAHAQLQFGGAVVPSSRRLVTRPWEVAAQLAVVVVLIVVGGLLIFEQMFERSSKPSTTESTAAGMVKVAEANAELEIPVVPVRQFDDHRGLVSGVAFDSRSSVLAARGNDGTIRAFDTDRGIRLAAFQYPPLGAADSQPRPEASILEFSSTGRWLLWANSDTSANGGVILKTWSMELKSFGKDLTSHQQNVMAAKFSPDESSAVAVVSAKREGAKTELVRWSLETGQEVQRLSLSEEDLRHVKFSGDGARLAAVLPNGNVGLWNVVQGKLEMSLPTAPVNAKKGGSNSALAFDADCSKLAVGTSSGEVSLWSLADGSLLRRYDGFGQQVSSLSFGPRDRLLVGLVNDLDPHQGEAQIIDLNLGQVRRRLRGHAVHAVAYSPDGRWIATGGSQPFLIQWDGSLPPAEISTPVREEKMTGRTHLAVAADGKSWFVATDGEKPKFQREGSNEWRVGSAASGNAIHSVALSSDGRLAAIGENGGVASLWKTDTGQLLRQTRFSACWVAADSYSEVPSLDFRMGNSEVLALCNGKLVAWDVQSGNESVLFEYVPRRVIAVSPDGQHAAAGGAKGALELFNLGTRKREQSFIGHTKDIHCLSFTPDGRHLVAGGGQDDLYLWRVESQEPVRRFNLPPSSPSVAPSISSVRFAVDGKMMAVAGRGIISVFDPATGEELARSVGGSAKANGVGFTSSGHLLSAAGSISWWSIKPPSAP